jgi:hypothetical protein
LTAGRGAFPEACSYLDKIKESFSKLFLKLDVMVKNDTSDQLIRRSIDWDELRRVFDIFLSIYETTFSEINDRKDRIVSAINTYLNTLETDVGVDVAKNQLDRIINDIIQQLFSLKDSLAPLRLTDLNITSQIEASEKVLFGEQTTNENEEEALTRKEITLKLSQDDVNDLLVIAKQICFTVLIHAETSIADGQGHGIICRLTSAPLKIQQLKSKGSQGLDVAQNDLSNPHQEKKKRSLG